jgi:hypothetical protein
VKFLYKIKSVPQKNINHGITTHTYTHILGNDRVLSIDSKIYKQFILMLILNLECFCVHQQRIVIQKDLYQLAEICIWYNEAFLIVTLWCQIPKYGPDVIEIRQ